MEALLDKGFLVSGGHRTQPLYMKNQKLRFVESLILLPMITIMPSQTVLSQKFNTAEVSLTFNQAIDSEANIQAKTLKIQAEAINAYFSLRNMPLEGMGMKMAIEADKNNIDWRLLPAIAVRESTGGKNDCTRVSHNFFGWGSCKISFKSDIEAIETVAKNLGGNNPNTATHYADKTIKQILRAYNPPSIVPNYAKQVMSIMNMIGPEDLGVNSNS